VKHRSRRPHEVIIVAFESRKARKTENEESLRPREGTGRRSWVTRWQFAGGRNDLSSRSILTNVGRSCLPRQTRRVAGSASVTRARWCFKTRTRQPTSRLVSGDLRLTSLRLETIVNVRASASYLRSSCAARLRECNPPAFLPREGVERGGEGRRARGKRADNLWR